MGRGSKLGNSRIYTYISPFPASTITPADDPILTDNNMATCSTPFRFQQEISISELAATQKFRANFKIIKHCKPSQFDEDDLESKYRCDCKDSTCNALLCVVPDMVEAALCELHIN